MGIRSFFAYLSLTLLASRYQQLHGQMCQGFSVGTTATTTGVSTNESSFYETYGLDFGSGITAAAYCLDFDETGPGVTGVTYEVVASIPVSNDGLTPLESELIDCFDEANITDVCQCIWSHTNTDGFSDPGSSGTNDITSILVLEPTSGSYQPLLVASDSIYGVTQSFCGPCVSATTITPYVNINGGGWTNASTATITSGNSLFIGTQAGLQSGLALTNPDASVDNTADGDSYFSVLSNAALSDAGIYSITYTDSEGCEATQEYTISYDSDVDGYGDENDLDDDNDGILDTDECSSPTITTMNLGTPSYESALGGADGVDDYSVGDVYRYSTVTTGVDILVEILADNPWVFSINSLDNKAGNQMGVSLHTDEGDAGLGLLELQFTLVKTGTTTDTALNFIAASIDVDGAGDIADIFGFNLGKPDSYSLESTTLLSSTTTGSDIYFKTDPIAADVSNVDPDFLVSATYVNTSTWKLIFGVDNGGSSVRNRNIDLDLTGSYISNYTSESTTTLKTTCDTDTDGDGISNSLDTDADADGCPDALEGAGTYTYSNIDVDNQLTATPDGNGQPGGASQGIGDSQDSGTQSNECTGCATGSTLFTDADGDGVGDLCDLDDDNDAISDYEEGRTEVWSITGGWNSNNGTVGDHDSGQNSSYIASLTDPLIVGSGLTFGLGGGDDFPEDVGYSTGSSMAIYGVDQKTMADAISNNDYLEIEFTTAASWEGDVELFAIAYAQYVLEGTSTIIGGQHSYGLQISDNNFSTSTLLKRSDMAGFAGSDDAFNTVTFNGADYTQYKAEFSTSYSLSTNTSYKIRIYVFNDEDGKFNLDDIYFNVIHSLDLDTDATANYLDSDTDGDACPDAIEGSGNFTASDLDVNDVLDYANLSPSGVDGNGIPNAAYGGQAAGDSQDAGTQDAACATLPIELLSFTLIPKKEGQVIVKWETLTETNNDFFTLERSRDAKSWEAFAVVNGAGNSVEIKTYKYIDREPFLGTSYYRLRQTDFDGKSTTSSILDMYIKPNWDSPLRVFPNPTKGLLTLEGIPDEIETYSFYDLQGREVTAEVKLLEIGTYQTQLDLSQLKKGIYILETPNHSIKVRKE